MLAGVLIWASSVTAHEAGKTRVDATFGRSGTYALRLTTDAGALLARLEIARKQPRPLPTSILDYQRRFDTVCDELAAHARLSFDGRPVRLQPVCVVDAELSGPDSSLSALGVTVALDGTVPAGSGSFVWAYDLTFTSYGLSFTTREGDGQETMWLEGGQESRAVPLVRSGGRAPAAAFWDGFSRGVTHVVPLGLHHVVFVVGVVLLGANRQSIAWQVSLWALADACGAALATDGALNIAPRVAEAGVWLVVIWLAAERMLTARRRTIWRGALMFATGLVHGLGAAERLGGSTSQPGTWLSVVGSDVGSWVAQLSVAAFSAFVLGSWVVTPTSSPSRAHR